MHALGSSSAAAGRVRALRFRRRGDLMPRRKSHASLQKELTDVLAPSFPGMEIEVGRNDRWDRVCVTFRWAGFAGTLPEERFRRLVMSIPEALRENHLRGVVWLELGPGESIDEYLALPRSEDIAGREAAIARRVIEADVFGALEGRMGSLPVEQCIADLSVTREVLHAKGFSARETQEACLLFIRHGAYCDADVVLEGKPSILTLEETS
jgi:hypothetical protein